MRIVIALGGNAIAARTDPAARNPLGRIAEAVSALADIVRGHDVVITHGNGPQIGWLAMHESEHAGPSGPDPLDVLGAETEGQLGYLFERELSRVFLNERRQRLNVRRAAHQLRRAELAVLAHLHIGVTGCQVPFAHRLDPIPKAPQVAR